MKFKIIEDNETYTFTYSEIKLYSILLITGIAALVLAYTKRSKPEINSISTCLK